MNSKIIKILKTASETVPYYNNLFADNNIEITESFDDEVFKKIPITTKETIKEVGWINFINNTYLNDNNDLDGSKKIRIEKTSGTTGENMHIAWDYHDFYTSTLSHWQFRFKTAGINVTDKCAGIWYRSNGNDPFCRSEYSLDLNKNLLTYKTGLEYIKALLEYQPVWIYMPSSILFYLIRIAEKEKIPFNDLPIRYIEFATEPVIPYYRKKIENYFNVEAHDMYGCQETNGIACECKYGNYHILSNNVHVEILDKENQSVVGKKGFVCITGIHNTLMPMIRYKLNDMAVMSFDKCSCGNPNPTLRLLSSRIPALLSLDDLNINKSGSVYYPLARFDTENFNDCIVFRLKFIGIRQCRVAFVNIEPDFLYKYSDVFKSIMHSYGIRNINFRFDRIKEENDKYHTGALILLSNKNGDKKNAN